MKNNNNNYPIISDQIIRSMTIQQRLCKVGAVICLSSSTVSTVGLCFKTTMSSRCKKQQKLPLSFLP
jgi:hypothetical protein